MASTSPKIRFYKFVTPPKSKGITISIGNKTVAGSDFGSAINAINSLGATVNSIGVMMQTNLASEKAAQQELLRNQQLMRDQALGKNLKQGTTRVGKKVGGLLSKAAPTFLEYLGRLLKSLLTFGVLDWLSKKENTEKLKVMMDRLGAFVKGMVEFIGNVTKFIGDAWNKTFGDGSSWIQRITGALKLLAVGGAALLGLSFLKNPIATVKNFAGILKMVSGGVMNLGRFLGGNVIGRGIQAATQGVMAYQDVLQDETIPEEDRQAAAVGAGVGATAGGMALGAIGNSIAGPLGGMIGNALGGWLGKHLGKFFGPALMDWIEKFKQFFAKVQEVVSAFMKPVTDAIRGIFESLGPAIDKVVDMIKPHMPKILQIANFIGKVVFAPLIGLLKGLKWLLDMFVGSDSDTVTESPSSEAGDTTPQASKGGPVILNMPLKSSGGYVRQAPIFNIPMKPIPTRSKGGWISGPQSGYPVSLTGRGVDFIGHGTEYVAQRSGGGYVVPVDTPHTRKDPGLTARSLKGAMLAGFGGQLPGRSKGGVVKVKAPEHKLPEFGLGGLFSAVGENVAKAVGGAQPIINAITPVANAILPGAGAAAGLGAKIIAMVKTLEQITAERQAANMQGAAQAVVLDMIEMPNGQGGGGDSGGTPIVMPRKQNPANPFLQSRFGYLGEGSTITSNFF